MAIRVGINGFGRIGRVVIRAAMEMPEIEIRAINLRNADLEYMVYMLRYTLTANMWMCFPVPTRWRSRGKKQVSIM